MITCTYLQQQQQKIQNSKLISLSTPFLFSSFYFSKLQLVSVYKFIWKYNNNDTVHNIGLFIKGFEGIDIDKIITLCQKKASYESRIIE